MGDAAEFDDPIISLKAIQFRSVFFSHFHDVDRVDWLVTDHLSSPGRLDPMGGLFYFLGPIKLEPLLLAHLKH
jgi:hypothetical protein